MRYRNFTHLSEVCLSVITCHAWYVNAAFSDVSGCNGLQGGLVQHIIKTNGIILLCLKTVYTLEMSRRENDKKIIALHVEMKDLMYVLVQYVQNSTRYPTRNFFSQG